MTLNKSDLIELVGKRAHLTHKAAEEAVEVFLGEIQKAIGRGDVVKIFGFGVFRTRRREKERSVRIPNTDKWVKVKPGRVPVFTPGTAFKRAAR